MGDITPHEERLFIDALQQLIGIKKGGEFGRKTKEQFIQYVQATQHESDISSLGRKQVLSYETLSSHTPEISRESFEESLFSFKGTPYKNKVADCSKLITDALKKVGAIPYSAFADSAAIIEQFTTQRKDISEIQKGDFIFWISKKISPRTGENIRHIMYTADVKRQDGIPQEILLFDRSSKTGEATFRTISF